MNRLLERSARYGVAVLRTLLVCMLLTGVTSAQPQADDTAPAEAATDDAAGWNFEDEEAEAAPTLLENARDQALDIGLFLAFAALAMVSFLRKSVPLKYVTLVAAVLYMGVYKSQLISVVNIFGTITGNLPVFSYSMAWYAFAIFTVVTTVLWGRLYCGRICAFGALTQLIDAVVPKRFQLEIPAVLERRAGYIKYGILFAAVGYYLADQRDRVLPLHRAVLAVHVRRHTGALDHGRRPARREHLRPQSLLPLPLPARRRARPRFEGHDGVRDQTLVRMQPVRAVREDVRVGCDSQAPDHQIGVRALRRLRNPLRRQEPLPALAARAQT